MAAMWRALALQGRNVNKLHSLRRPSLLQPACFISTSKKNKDVTIPVQPVEMPQKTPELKKLEEHFADADPRSDKNYTTYGYDPSDPNFDTFAHHMTMFMAVTICLCWGSFVLAYQPDYRNQDWYMREAYLELERREKHGLPLISQDYVDPETIDLPSDEELEADGVEIIV